MKGMALPMETIVILVLAIIVFAAVLAFFLGIFPGASNEVRLEADRNRLCGRYATTYPDCDNLGEESEGLREELAGVCAELGYSYCYKGSPAGISCVIQCCSVYCQGNLCEDEGGECYYGPCKDVGGGTFEPVGGVCPSERPYCCKSIEKLFLANISLSPVSYQQYSFSSNSIRRCRECQKKQRK